MVVNYWTKYHRCHARKRLGRHIAQLYKSFVQYSHTIQNLGSVNFWLLKIMVSKDTGLFYNQHPDVKFECVTFELATSFDVITMSVLSRRFSTVRSHFRSIRELNFLPQTVENVPKFSRPSEDEN